MIDSRPIFDSVKGGGKPRSFPSQVLVRKEAGDSASGGRGQQIGK